MAGCYFFRTLIFLCLSIFLNINAQAQAFEVQSALNELNQFTLKYPLGKTRVNAYEQVLSTLSEHIDEAQECVLHAKKELIVIKSLLSEAQSLEGSSIQADLVYLKKQQNDWIKTQSLCRLYLLKANEQMLQFKKNIIQLKEQSILLKNQNILTLCDLLFNANPLEIAPIWNAILALIHEMPLKIALYMLGVLFLLGALYYVFSLPVLKNVKYLSLLISTELLFIQGLTELNELDVFPSLLWMFIEIILINQIALSMIVLLFFYVRKIPRLTHPLRVFLFCVPLFATPILLSLIGYVNLSIQFEWALFLTLLISFLLFTCLRGIDKTYQYLYLNPSLKTKLIDLFGYKPEQLFTEFLILKITLQCLVCVLSLLFMIKNTGFTNETLEFSADHIITGISIGHLTLYPLRIALGTCLYCIIYLAARALSTKVAKQYQIDNEEETQVAIASLLNYGGFSLAVILGALIAGFDFTGLAIIAGALSVGIGFGLQSIVNNFVSGLILLIEKPIKPGDKISVNGVEGLVKKIRVRSTHLINGAREDIIIPNSDLMTQQVTNYMLTDKQCRIFLDIGVTYGTSTELVKDTLTAIALQHPEIIKTEKNKPVVLFTAFQDSALNFQLNCLIKDINKRGTVLSDLHFEIERIFREKNIQMPFPQREVYVSFTPSS